MLTQKQRKAADASAAAIDPAEAARLEREAIRAELATKPGEGWDKDAKRPAAELAAEAATRKAAGRRALVAVPRGTGTAATTKPKPISWSGIAVTDANRWELASYAAECKRLEREARRNAIPDAFTVQAVRRSAVVMLEDLSAAELAKAASAKRVTGAKSDYDQLAKVAADLGVEVAELDAMIAAEKLLVADGSPVVQDSKAEVGYASAATPSEVADRKEYVAELLLARNAVAGRKVLDAIGPRASAVVISELDTDRVTVAQVRTVPDISAARIRIEALTKPLAEARERLSAAIAKEDAARAAKAVRPLKSAEADTARIAAGVAKIQKRMDAAKAAEALALELAALPSAEGLVTVPLETFKLAEAAEAGALEIPERTDRMPSAFVERGPRVRTSASWSGETAIGGRGTGVADPTGNSAAALADGYARELAKVERLAAELAYRTSREALESVAEAARENQRSARKAADAERKRAARRAGKVKPRSKH